MNRNVLSAVLTVGVLTLLTGVAYPLAVTGLAALFCPGRASGSLVFRGGRAVGSALLGQDFSDPAHFWGRGSATRPFPCNPSLSTGSNLGPANPALLEAVERRLHTLRSADPENASPVPVDLVTASASGLDPHISPDAAFYQVRRVAKARGASEEALRALVEAHMEGRTWGILGEPRVNVMELNLALDERYPGGAPPPRGIMEP
ncbi:MAG: potassium-transporting ATPase subunit KdpC [Acidobacteriota bacterium]